ncbi:hypothetical protein IAU60_004888 [Kwoniella sp. DSM 27419]
MAIYPSDIASDGVPAPGKVKDTVTQPWIETPLIESTILSKLAGCHVYLKLENLQPSRSFKSRGIGNLVMKAVQRDPTADLTFYAPSGGNAGLACVVAATTLGKRSVVVVPLSTKQSMIDKLLRSGAADVIQHGQNIAEADLYLRERLLPNDLQGVYVPPFDHEDIWQGAETLVEEVYDQLGEKPDGIVCSVGGGGLLVGICQGLDMLDQRDTPPGRATQVVGVETVGCESFHLALKAQALITLPGITSLATSLGCVRVAAKAFEYGQRDNVHSTLVTDGEACDACIRFADDERMLVEPACGATLALIYSGRLGEVLQVTPESKVVLVVCGGSNVSLATLAMYKEMFEL